MQDVQRSAWITIAYIIILLNNLSNIIQSTRYSTNFKRPRKKFGSSLRRNDFDSFEVTKAPWNNLYFVIAFFVISFIQDTILSERTSESIGRKNSVVSRAQKYIWFLSVYHEIFEIFVVLRELTVLYYYFEYYNIITRSIYYHRLILPKKYDCEFRRLIISTRIEQKIARTQKTQRYNNKTTTKTNRSRSLGRIMILVAML